MKLRAITVTAASLALVVGGASPAAAKPHAKKPKKHPKVTLVCPDGYTAAGENWVSSVDLNANGIVCVDRLSGAIVDDNPTGETAAADQSTGSCPPEFDMTGVAAVPTADLNANGVICFQAATAQGIAGSQSPLTRALHQLPIR